MTHFRAGKKFDNEIVLNRGFATGHDGIGRRNKTLRDRTRSL